MTKILLLTITTALFLGVSIQVFAKQECKADYCYGVESPWSGKNGWYNSYQRDFHSRHAVTIRKLTETNASYTFKKSGHSKNTSSSASTKKEDNNKMECKIKALEKKLDHSNNSTALYSFTAAVCPVVTIRRLSFSELFSKRGVKFSACEAAAKWAHNDALKDIEINYLVETEKCG